MKCSKCGKEIANDSNFCEFCGAQVCKRTSSNAFGGFLIVMALLFVIGLMSVTGFLFGEKGGLVETEEDIAEVEVPVEIEAIFSQPEEYYCDGVYYCDNETEHGLYIRVPNLNKNHFRLSFSFYPLSYKGSLGWTDAQYPMILGEGSRALGVCLKSDGKIHITTHNHNNIYDTDISYLLNEYNDVNLEYNNGDVIINGNVLHVGMLNISNDDLIFTSKCYSTGNAFKGYIKDISIYNIDSEADNCYADTVAVAE